MTESIDSSSTEVFAGAVPLARGGHGANFLTDLAGLQQSRQGRYLGKKRISAEKSVEFKRRAYALAVGLRRVDFSAGFFAVLLFLAARSAARESVVEAAERFRDEVARPLPAAACAPDSTDTEGRG